MTLNAAKPGELALERARGGRFEDDEVVRCYRYRPAYPAALYDFLLQRVRGRRGLLDLGCGAGKIVRALAPHFARADAVDPSRAMIDAARDELAVSLPSVNWQRASGEEATFRGPYDLVTAGASIHWMDAARVMPKVARHLHPEGVMAVIDGDGPEAAVWIAGFRDFEKRWLARLGRSWGAGPHVANATAHREWIAVSDERRFVADVAQPLLEFVECQHSRATWARAAMGMALATEFDRELSALLAPFSLDGLLHYRIATRLTLARPCA